MEKNKELISDICLIDNFSYKCLSDLIEKYNKKYVCDIFNSLYMKAENKEAFHKKYCAFFIYQDLNSMTLDENSYFILMDKYGQADLLKYFRDYLKSPDVDQKKYNDILKYIENDFLCDEKKDTSKNKKKYKEDFYSDDSTAMYLNDISQYPLFTPEEEKQAFTELGKVGNCITLAYFDSHSELYYKNIDEVIASINTYSTIDKLKNASKYMSDDDKKRVDEFFKYLEMYCVDENSFDDFIKNYILFKMNIPSDINVISEEEIINNFNSIEEYIKIRNMIVEKNLGFVVAIAKKYFSKTKSLTFLDLINEGNLGLMKAINKFDCNRGFKFSTYANWWIKQTVTRGIKDSDDLIRLPIHVVEDVSKYSYNVNNLKNIMGRDNLTSKEIAENLNISLEKVEEYEVILANRVPFSLNYIVGDSEDDSLEDFVCSKEKTSQEILEDSDKREKINMILDTLPIKEKLVIEYRFGLNGNRTMTLEEVGQIFGVTRERIRQIEARALIKLKSPTRSRIVKDYY